MHILHNVTDCNTAGEISKTKVFCSRQIRRKTIHSHTHTHTHTHSLRVRVNHLIDVITQMNREIRGFL